MFQYIIQTGDNLNRIADQFGVTVAAILAANVGLNPQVIFPGQIILIPINVPLRQSYPWYFLLPNLFNRYPRYYWDNRHHWPRNWQERDGRGPGGGPRGDGRGHGGPGGGPRGDGRRSRMDGWSDTDSTDV